jgi:hypothetical protein
VPYAVATGLISQPVPGVWRRLSAVSHDGSMGGLAEPHVVGKLEELGIPRHHYGIIRVVQSWRRAAVPPDVAFSLWLLRESLSDGGGMPRRRGRPAEDTGPAIRYLQLALAAGETLETDPAIGLLADWLLEQQCEDGSIPANLGVSYGEAGTTARALRVLRQLPEVRFAQATERMRRYLLASSVTGHEVRAWSYGGKEPTLVAGATSLAGMALLDAGEEADCLEAVSSFMISVQHKDGGWSEVAGYAPTIHNTFNAVRYLRSAAQAGILPAETDSALHRARAWFDSQLKRRPPKTSIELAHVVRLAVQLGMCPDRRVEQLAVRLSRLRSVNLAADADLYAETEITALALLEASRCLDSLPGGGVAPWQWRWSLPSLPPPFLGSTVHLYELLYGLARSPRWIRLVDRLVGSALVDRMAGLLLGAVAALGFVDDFVTSAMANLGSGVRGGATVALILGAAALWLAIKAGAHSSVLRAVRASIGSAVVTAMLTWVVNAPVPIYPSGLVLIALRWLVVDIVTHTADSTGLLNRMTTR